MRNCPPVACHHRSSSIPASISTFMQYPRQVTNPFTSLFICWRALAEMLIQQTNLYAEGSEIAIIGSLHNSGLKYFNLTIYKCYVMSVDIGFLAAKLQTYSSVYSYIRKLICHVR
jgi:hypothetical protein